MKRFKSIPKGWESKLIPEVLFFQEGPGVRKWQFTEEGVKLLNVGNINNQKINLDTTKIHISEEEAYGKYKHFLIDEGDLLIACSGIVVSNFYNKIAFIDKKHLPLCLNTSTMRFKSLENSIDLNYFRYYLQTKYFTKQLQKLITGSAQLNFGPSHIKKIEVLLPPLDQQKKIAAILDAADGYRQKTKALILKYDELTQSLFLDMFGDPVTNPKGWEETVMNEVCSKVTDGTHDTPERLKEGIKFITGKHIRPYTIDYDNSDYVTEKVHQEIYRRCNPEKNDVLYTNIGVNLGTAALNKVDFEFSMKNVALLKPLSSFITGRYIEYFLNSGNMKAKIVWMASLGGAQQFLSLTQLRRLKINTPPLDLQNQFAERVQAIEAQKAQAQESLAKAEDLFNSLLQKAFKGELT